MKKNIIAPVMAVALAAVFAFGGCAGASNFRLAAFDGPVPLHTELQSSFLSDDNEAIVAYADGTRELSRPAPVTLTWSGVKAAQYLVEISENEKFSPSQKFSAAETTLDVYNLKIATKYYWRVSEEGETSPVSSFTTEDVGPRNLYVEGVTNVRDLGGWKTENGGRVVQGLIFRGGRLNKSDVNDDGYATPPSVFVPEITASGADVFKNSLRIKTEIDLRLPARNGYPSDMVPTSAVEGVNYVSIPMNGNASIIDSEVNELALKDLMELLADKSVYPVYIHCNIGTDRTGLVAYLLNALCGVGKEDLLRDYLFSNFGNIGEAKSPSNSKNKYMDLLDDETRYPGSTLSARVESFFRSIGVSEETVAAVRAIMMGGENA